MNKKELKDELRLLNEDISNKIILRKRLENSLIELSDDFIERFKIWYNNDTNGHYSSIITKYKFPLLRPYFEDLYEPNRYATYDLYDIFEVELYSILETKDFYDNGGTDEEYKGYVEFITPYLKEAMQNEMKSFVCDW